MNLTCIEKVSGLALFQTASPRLLQNGLCLHVCKFSQGICWCLLHCAGSSSEDRGPDGTATSTSSDMQKRNIVNSKWRQTEEKKKCGREKAERKTEKRGELGGRQLENLSEAGMGKNGRTQEDWRHEQSKKSKTGTLVPLKEKKKVFASQSSMGVEMNKEPWHIKRLYMWLVGGWSNVSNTRTSPGVSGSSVKYFYQGSTGAGWRYKLQCTDPGKYPKLKSQDIHSRVWKSLLWKRSIVCIHTYPYLSKHAPFRHGKLHSGAQPHVQAEAAADPGSFSHITLSSPSYPWD